MAVLLGGRAAEKLVFEQISTGAADDLAKATDIARSMVTRYAMVPGLGPVTYDNESQSYLGPQAMSRRTFSEETAREIDSAVREIRAERLRPVPDPARPATADAGEGGAPAPREGDAHRRRAEAAVRRRACRGSADGAARRVAELRCAEARVASRAKVTAHVPDQAATATARRGRAETAAEAVGVSRGTAWSPADGRCSVASPLSS